ncbi:MAG: hypothetical protein H0W44_00385 [Gammaproteobacteria bacterium]|nr:hypothetical protein [Gammaproteobacteria bacterium]
MTEQRKGLLLGRSELVCEQAASVVVPGVLACQLIQYHPSADGSLIALGIRDLRDNYQCLDSFYHSNKISPVITRVHEEFILEIRSLNNQSIELMVYANPQTKPLLLRRIKRHARILRLLGLGTISLLALWLSTGLLYDVFATLQFQSTIRDFATAEQLPLPDSTIWFAIKSLATLIAIGAIVAMTIRTSFEGLMSASLILIGMLMYEQDQDEKALKAFAQHYHLAPLTDKPHPHIYGGNYKNHALWLYYVPPLSHSNAEVTPISAGFSVSGKIILKLANNTIDNNVPAPRNNTSPAIQTLPKHRILRFAAHNSAQNDGYSYLAIRPAPDSLAEIDYLANALYQQHGQ